ncbi:MAG: hypothetical protein VX707_00300 [Chloroflexota bacterium]|nr:hypothetical protein [Chloroflexota bacterium]
MSKLSLVKTTKVLGSGVAVAFGAGIAVALGAGAAVPLGAGADVDLGAGADVACGTALSDPHAASSRIRTVPIARIAVDLIIFEWFLPEIFEIYLLAVRKWPENLKK